jgi:hypothetical protein
MRKRHGSFLTGGKHLLGRVSNCPKCFPPASPRSGRKIVAHGASRGRIGPHPARAPLGAKEITTKGNGATAFLGATAQRGDVESPQGWVLSPLRGWGGFYSNICKRPANPSSSIDSLDLALDGA